VKTEGLYICLVVPAAESIRSIQQVLQKQRTGTQLAMSDSASEQSDIKLEVEGDRKASKPLRTEDVSERRHIHQPDERLLKSWWKETLWMLLAYGLLAALFLLLKSFKIWRSGLRYNTVIAIATTSIRVCLMAIVESGTKFVQKIIISLMQR
jgi:hypothetical protein